METDGLFMASPHGPRPGRHSRARLRIALLLSLGAVVVSLALALSAGTTLSHALSPGAFAAMAGESFDRGLRVETVRLALLPRPWIYVEKVSIDGLGTAEAAQIELRLRPLLEGRIEVNRVRFEEPHFVLHRGPDGDFLPIFGAGVTGDGPLPPRLEAESGELRIVQGEQVTVVMRIDSLSLGRFHGDHTAELVLAGQLAGGDGRWRVHPLHLRGRLLHTPDRIALLDGRLRGRQVSVAWWQGEDARARFRYEDGRVRIDSIEVRGFGGTWRIAGTARLRGGTHLELTAVADGIDVAALGAASEPGGAPGDLGRLRFRFARLSVPWEHGPRWERATGAGDLRVLGGTVGGHSLLAALGVEPGPNPLREIVAPVTLAEGRLRSDGLRMETTDYTLDAAGSLGLDRSLDLEGEVRLAGTMLPPVPVTIGGALGRPEVDAHVSHLPARGIGAIVRTTGRGIQGALGALGAAGRKAGGLLAPGEARAETGDDG